MWKSTAHTPNEFSWRYMYTTYTETLGFSRSKNKLLKVILYISSELLTSFLYTLLFINYFALVPSSNIAFTCTQLQYQLMKKYPSSSLSKSLFRHNLSCHFPHAFFHYKTRRFSNYWRISTSFLGHLQHNFLYYVWENKTWTPNLKQ